MKCAAEVPTAEPQRIKEMLQECGWDVEGAIYDLKEEELGKKNLQRRLQDRPASFRGVSGSDLARRQVSKEGEGEAEPQRLKPAPTLLSTVSNPGRDAHKENQGAPEKMQTKRFPTPRATAKIDEGQALKPDKLQTKRVPTPRATGKDDEGQVLKSAKSARYEKMFSFLKIYFTMCRTGKENMMFRPQVGDIVFHKPSGFPLWPCRIIGFSENG